MNATNGNGIPIIQGVDAAIAETHYSTGWYGSLYRLLLFELKARRSAMGIPPDSERDKHFDHSTLEIGLPAGFNPEDCGGA